MYKNVDYLSFVAIFLQTQRRLVGYSFIIMELLQLAKKTQMFGKPSGKTREQQ